MNSSHSKAQPLRRLNLVLSILSLFLAGCSPVMSQVSVAGQNAPVAMLKANPTALATKPAPAQTVLVPTRTATPALLPTLPVITPSVKAPVISVVDQAGGSYCLWPGDTFSAIAQAAHVDLSALQAANPDVKDEAGVTIHLPPGSLPPAQWEQVNLPHPVINPPIGLPFGESGYYLSADNRHKRVALTFDIGYVPENQARMVWLHDQGIHATFFVLGISMSRHPEVVKDVLSNGHTLGSHSWDHLNFQNLTIDQIQDEFQKTEKAVNNADASATTKPYFRAPFGAIDQRVQVIAKEQGYHIIGWTVDSGDWLDNADEEQVYQQVTQQVCPGAIILMHDANPANIGALPRIVDFLRKNGYEIVSLHDLLGL